METEQKLQAKKEWETPELIILVRSKPEDAVLLECKIDTGKWGSEVLDKGCIKSMPSCSWCSTRGQT